MCSVVPGTALSPLCELYSMTYSKLLRSQRIICPKHCFISTEYIKFLLHFQNYLEPRGRPGGQGVLCVVRGGVCVSQLT